MRSDDVRQTVGLQEAIDSCLTETHRPSSAGRVTKPCVELWTTHPLHVTIDSDVDQTSSYE